MKEQNFIEDEIKLKDLILMIQEYFNELLKNWIWIILITIPFILFFLNNVTNLIIRCQKDQFG